MFEPSSFSIILKRDLTQREQELVNRYWEFDQDNLSKFKSTVTSLNIEFADLKLKTHSSVSNTISELAYLCTTDCKCFQCGQLIQFKTRNEIKHLADTDYVLENIDIFRKTTICLSCEKKNLQLKLDESVNSIMILVNKIESLANNKQVDLENLTYLEQLYLSIYLDYAYSSGRVQIDKSIINEDCDFQIANALLEKGYLIDFTTKNSLINDLLDQKEFIQAHKNYLTVELRNKIETYLSKLPKPGIYINSAFNPELKASLMNQIKNIDNLSFQQLKEIESIVKTVLVKQAVDITQIAANYYKVHTNFDEAFGHTLEIATWNHSMRMICNLIFYQTKSMAAEIQAGRVTGPLRNHYLRRNIESHLNYLRENREAKKYYSNLPQRIVVPALIDFVIKIFMKDELSWDALSGQEIVAKWANYDEI